MANRPEGWHTVTSRLLVEDPGGLVRFIKTVFQASGERQLERPSEIWIGDSVIMVSDASTRRPTSACLYVYVDDVDSVWERARAEGATAIEPPTDLPWGDRRVIVEDAWGNMWQIATRTGPAD
tara:strand:+ start:64 stop:432 length:369 start_codon:yes stop_codon:yes gene_type:complete